MLGVNLLNQAYLESELEGIGCLEITEELIEKMREVVPYYRESEQFIIELATVINNIRHKIYALFMVLENEDGELETSNVEVHSVGYKIIE
ncbi:hypothetical protein P9D31_05455 [Bacillus haynesii]|uniref:hypothetical protein n=1 Tax=Bacillus TaxID=1386 RepID=UPI00227ECE4C|nr:MULTISPECIES: hypothetical protein [Bacillus]MCY8241422.1 hypothetical protein [Bacillus haynesii]MCY8529877.1 hypothetical protein [Bacillus licheniformis]MEC0792988.1 hypothetical protein [Bacillus licheniformis]MEC1471800.1 hypothetical protein [Bacillus haynesii]MEC1486424.1 hypothetical protein [Bacillus haynesii]